MFTEKVVTTKKQLRRDLKKLKVRLKDNYFTQRARAINEKHELRKSEEFFRLAKDTRGPLVKANSSVNCSEEAFVAHFSTHFRDRKLPMPAEICPETRYTPTFPDDAPTIDMSDPTLDEVKRAVSQLKHHKACGSDGVANEQLRYANGSASFMALLLHLTILIWNCPTVPPDWLVSTITTVHKKGPTDIPSNYRPISMISTVSKIVTKVLNYRVRPRYEAILSRDQFGFRRSSGTTDAIYVLRELVRKKKVPITALFLDLRGAFDLIDRKQLFAVLEIQLGSEKTVDILRAYYTGTQGKIKGGTTLFELATGVRQGAEESTWSFCLFFDYVLAIVKKIVAEREPLAGVEFKYNIKLESNPDATSARNQRSLERNPRERKATEKTSGIERLFQELFADDLVLLDTDPDRLSRVLLIVQDVFARFGLIIAADKTKSMQFNTDTTITGSIFSLDSTQLQHVDRFRYLGHNLSATNNSHFLECQIGSAWAAFNHHRQTLCDNRINIAARVLLLNSLVRSRLLYSVQAWHLNVAQSRHLECVYRNFLRKMIFKGFRKYGTTDGEHNEHAFVITNAKLYAITNTIPLSDFINAQFLKYTAHVSRMPNNKWQKLVLFMDSETRTRSTWKICGDLLGGMDESQTRRTMQNRKDFFSAISSRFGTLYA